MSERCSTHTGGSAQITQLLLRKKKRRRRGTGRQAEKRRRILWYLLAQLQSWPAAARGLCAQSCAAPGRRSVAARHAATMRSLPLTGLCPRACQLLYIVAQAPVPRLSATWVEAAAARPLLRRAHPREKRLHSPGCLVASCLSCAVGCPAVPAGPRQCRCRRHHRRRRLRRRRLAPGRRCRWDRRPRRQWHPPSPPWALLLRAPRPACPAR